MTVGQYSLDVRCTTRKNQPQTVILLHGIGVSGAYFLPFAEVLAVHFDVRVLDLPGYGKTPHPDHALSPTELADVVVEYMTRANITSAIIIGQSMGCQIAARLAMRHPMLCKKLVLIGPTVNKWERNLLMQGMRLLQDSLREPIRANGVIFGDYLRMGMLRYLQTSKYMIEDHLEECARAITSPTLIVRGSQDRIAPQYWTEYLATCMSNAKTVEVADAPHAVQFVRPNALFESCADFLVE